MCLPLAITSTWFHRWTFDKVPSAYSYTFFPVFGSLASVTVFLDGFIFLLRHLPAQTGSHLVYGFGHELLHMETVVDECGFWEIRGDSLHGITDSGRKFVQDSTHSICRNAPYHGHQCSRRT